MLSTYKKEHELKIDVVNISNKHETKLAARRGKSMGSMEFVLKRYL